MSGVDPSHIIETVRLWWSPVVLTAILGLASRHYLRNKQLDVDAEGAARDAYASAVRGFREEVRALKAEHTSDKESWERRHKECETARDDFKEKVGALRDLVAGLNRVILQASKDKVLALGDYPSEEVHDAAERVDKLFRKGKGNGDSSR